MSVRLRLTFLVCAWGALTCGCTGELGLNAGDERARQSDEGGRDQGASIDDRVDLGAAGDIGSAVDGDAGVDAGEEDLKPLVPACQPGELWPVDQPLKRLSSAEVLLHLNRVFYGYELATFHQDIRSGKKPYTAAMQDVPGATVVYPDQGWDADSFTNQAQPVAAKDVTGFEKFASWYVYKVSGRRVSANGPHGLLIADVTMYGTEEAPGWAPCRVERNASREEMEACAEEIVDVVVPKLIRRPFDDDAERSSYLAYMQASLDLPLSKEISLHAYRHGLQQFFFTVLQSPEVHYLMERGEEGVPGAALTPFELANRLSFFLWRAGPDEELWAAAASGDLSDPVTLEAQARRMLADDRARQPVLDFFIGWLKLDKLSQVDVRGQYKEKLQEISFALEPYPYGAQTCFEDPFKNTRDARGEVNAFRGDTLPPHYTRSLGESVRRFVEWSVWEQDSFVELLSSSTMPANFFLSSFYDWPEVALLPAKFTPNPGVGGDCSSPEDDQALKNDFREMSKDHQRRATQGWELVDLPPEQYAGVLTHPGVLAMSSHDAEHSPIYRGVHLINALLCADVAFPGDVPPQMNTQQPCTVRQRVEWAHSASTACQTCHGLIDGLGFSFEHYDAFGKWRAQEECQVPRLDEMGMPIVDGSGRPRMETKTFDVDASVVVPDVDPAGEPIDVAGSYTSAPQLAKSLSSSRRVKACMTAHLTRYAFGRREFRGKGGTPEARGCQKQQIEELVDAMDSSGGSLQELFIALILSPSFRHKAMIDLSTDATPQEAP